MLDLKQIDKEYFIENGYLINGILKNEKDFNQISLEFKNNLNELLLKNNLIKMGGYKSGNLNFYPGIYGKKILYLLKKHKFDEYFNFLTNDNIESYKVLLGGNLNFNNSKYQFFHTDGNWNPRMIVLNIATSNIDKTNGPLEIIAKSHKYNFSYWRFSLANFFAKKKKISLNEGEILIREHRLWHRGTKNNSENTREMMGIMFIKRQDNEKIEISNEENTNNIYIHPNIFGNSKKEKIKEFIFINFKFILFFYKFLKSFIKKK